MDVITTQPLWRTDYEKQYTKEMLTDLVKRIDVGKAGRAKTDVRVGAVGEGGLHGDPIWVASTTLRKAQARPARSLRDQPRQDARKVLVG